MPMFPPLFKSILKVITNNLKLKSIILLLLIIEVPLLDVYAEALKNIPGFYYEGSILGDSFVTIKDGKNKTVHYMNNFRFSLFIFQVSKISPNFYWNLFNFEAVGSRLGSSNDCGISSYYLSYNNFTGTNCLIDVRSNNKREILFTTYGSKIRYSIPLEIIFLYSSLSLGIGNYSNNDLLLNPKNQKIFAASLSIGIQYPIPLAWWGEGVTGFLLFAELFTTKRSVTNGAIFNNSGLDISEIGWRFGIISAVSAGQKTKEKE